MSKNDGENRFNAAQNHFSRIKEEFWPIIMLFAGKKLVPGSPGYSEFEHHMQRFLSKLQNWHEVHSRPQFINTPQNFKAWVDIHLEALELIKTATGDCPLEKAKESHQQAMNFAVHIRSLSPSLPKVPLITFDPGTPTMGLLSLKEWCSDSQEKVGIEQNITPAKRWAMGVWLKRIPRWIYYLVLFLAALLTCLYYFGLLEQIKAFIYKILRLT